MEGVMTSEGQAIDLDLEAGLQAFNQVQAQAAEPDSIPAPPKMSQEQKERVSTEAPKRRGRPGKNERARTAKTAVPTAPQTDQERSDGIKGLVQLGAGLCLVADQRTPEDDISFQADAITLAASADQIADAVVQTCKSSESFARAVDKVTKAGPYAALVGVMFSVGAQIARNHGVKAAEMMGAVPPEQLIASVMEDGTN